MILSLLVAVAKNGVIGKDNKLPWHLPNDLKYFKNLTWGMPILMGRKTFESIGKPLPGRKSIVITRNKDWKDEGVEAVHSIEKAIKVAKSYNVKEVFVIGGAEIFNTSLPQAQRIYLTAIHEEFEGDAFFPALGKKWNLVNEKACAADDKNKYAHTFQVYEKERP